MQNTQQMEKPNKYAKYFSDKNEKVHMTITAQITFIDINKDKTHTFMCWSQKTFKTR